MNKKLFIQVLICSIGLFVSCDQNQKYEDYTYDEVAQCYYKLVSFGDSNRKVCDGDVVTMNVGFSPVNTTPQTVFDTVLHIHNSDKLDLSRILLGHQDEDSIIYILSTKEFVCERIDASQENKDVQISVKINAVVDSVTYEKQLRWAEEDVQIQQYIEFVGEKYEPIDVQIYKRQIKAGYGDYPEVGNVVSISFQGSLLNGDIIQHFTTMDFSLGSEYQVIEGIAIAIQNMRKGERSQLVFTSQYAWGEKGSSNGLIPPYTPVIFDVELLQITK